MGALLGQGDLAVQEFEDPQLNGIWDAIKDVGSFAFGGTAGYLLRESGIISSGEASCGQRRKEMANAIRTYLTAADRYELVRGMESRVAPTPEAMAFFFMGEGDCKHRNVGDRHKRFLRELPRKIEQRVLEQQAKIEQQQSTQTNTDIQPSPNGGTQTGGNGGTQDQNGTNTGSDPEEDSNMVTYAVIAGGAVILIGISAALLS